MAFHPFRTFRRHQKVIWGFLVIVCMITFVLASGNKGDIFDRLSNMVRASRGTTTVTELYKQKIDTRQIQNLRQQRSLGLEALAHALSTAEIQVEEELNKV